MLTPSDVFALRALLPGEHELMARSMQALGPLRGEGQLRLPGIAFACCEIVHWRTTSGQREPNNLLHHRAELLAQRPGVVGHPVALTDLPHLRRDLGVSVSR